MEPFEGSGWWHLPEAADSPVPGTLRVSERGEISLSLLGVLGAREDIQEGKRFPIVIGSVDGPLGNRVTLVRCFRTGIRLGSFQNSRETYQAQQGYFGANLPQDSDLTFRRLQLRLGGLRVWAAPLAGLELNLDEPKFQERSPLLSYRRSDSVVASVPGGEVSLGVGLNISDGLAGVHLTEEPAFTVTTDTPLSEAELQRRFIAPLQNLLTFACDAPQAVEGVSLWREDVLAEVEDNPEIKLVAARVFPEGEEPEEGNADVGAWGRLHFNVSDLQPDFSAFLSRWLRLMETHADACNVYFGLAYAPPTFLDHTFAGLVQSLYLYHTRRAEGGQRRQQEEARLQGILSRLGAEDADWVRNRLEPWPYPPTQDVLAELLGEHADLMRPILQGGPSDLVAAATNTLRHVLLRDPEVAPAASRGADLYWMTARLRVLMKLCLFKELALPATKVQAIFQADRTYPRLAEQGASRR